MRPGAAEAHARSDLLKPISSDTRPGWTTPSFYPNRYAILEGRRPRAVPSNRKRLVELTFPSIFGYEKVAMATVAAFARRHGIVGEKANDLCTAVAEACVNAIVYGHDGRPESPTHRPAWQHGAFLDL